MAPKTKEIWSVGRRKTSIARAKLTDGTGKITVNHKTIKDFMGGLDNRVNEAIKPLTLIGATGKYDIMLNVHGGGYNGQIGAIRHALARALSNHLGTETKSSLKKEGFLTRDPRMVERKKYGKHKARRGTQFSKR
ncbi:MAG: 30S ribosomal protein S9 [Leptospiraceae bacterium]|nr:30S ribosomal protein S9 [Leptospiraceae bacterium]MCK6382485.1 30S ribosomal protein S9 [Leptospiraceae bacterium]